MPTGMSAVQLPALIELAFHRAEAVRAVRLAFRTAILEAFLLFCNPFVIGLARSLALSSRR
jgi:hypothetical protein